MPESHYQNETLAQVFSSGFCQISENTFYTEHLRETVSETKDCSSKAWLPVHLLTSLHIFC